MEPLRNWRAVKVVLTSLPVINWSFWVVVNWETKEDAFW